MVSVIIPTYNEAENVGPLIKGLSAVLDREGIEHEIIVVDDDSPDGTATAAAALSKTYPVRVHIRKGKRGLSGAVIEGFRLARGMICAVMDADLSHPVETLPDMIRPIVNGRCDATVGSRYIDGGGTGNWSSSRRLTSKLAGALAKGVTRLSDPTTGFMAIKKSFIAGQDLDPTGWKIVLETIVKTGPRVKEIPIVFSDRERGESKLSPGVQLDYVRHLRRLYCFKYRGIAEFLKFCMVGLSGVIVDTAALVAVVRLLSFDPRLAAVFAFTVAVSWNYVLDRAWTFDCGRSTRIPRSYVAFVTICVVGLGIRLLVMHLCIEYARMGESPWYILASLFGILIATVFNYLGSKYIAFDKSFD